MWCVRNTLYSINYHDYVIIVVEVLVYTFLLLLPLCKAPHCVSRQPLLVRYRAVELTAINIIIIIIINPLLALARFL